MLDLKYSLNNLVEGPRDRVPSPQKWTGLMDTDGNGRKAMGWCERLPRNMFRKRRVERTEPSPEKNQYQGSGMSRTDGRGWGWGTLERVIK